MTKGERRKRLERFASDEDRKVFVWQNGVSLVGAFAQDVETARVLTRKKYPTGFPMIEKDEPEVYDGPFAFAHWDEQRGD